MKKKNATLEACALISLFTIPSMIFLIFFLIPLIYAAVPDFRFRKK